MNAKMIFSSIAKFASRHKGELLIGTGLALLLGTAGTTAYGTMKAVKQVQEKETEKGSKLTKKEIFKTTYKNYIIPVSTAVAGTILIISGMKVHCNREAALVAAYTLSETALNEYQTKARDILGPKKEQEIHEAVSKDIVEKTNNVVIASDGKTLFYEPISGRIFQSTWTDIQRIVNELNANAMGNWGVVTESEWFDALGLDRTLLSDEFGWDVKDGKNAMLDISLDATVKDGKPMGCIYYNVRPKRY